MPHQNIVIIGATSAMAECCARVWAARGARMVLLARDAARAENVAADLRVRGAPFVQTLAFDATQPAAHQAAVAEAIANLGHIDIALVAHGSLPDQAACEQSFEAAQHALDVNFMSVVSVCTHLANHFESRGAGTLAVIGSVAGDRGRQSNYVYGAAKGAVAVFLQGLRNRLHRAGAHVVTIKPGFVDTPMTAGIQKGGPLWAQPADVARVICHAIDKQRDVVYVPFFWAGIMWVIRSVPERVFKRLSL